MPFYSDPIELVKQTDHKNRIIAIMSVTEGASCECSGHDCTPKETHCALCGVALTHATVFIALIDNARLSGYFRKVEEAIANAKLYIDQLDEAAKKAAPPQQLTGKKPANDLATDTGATSDDAVVLTKITQQGAALNWGMQLAAILGLGTPDEKQGRPRLPGPRG